MMDLRLIRQQLEDRVRCKEIYPGSNGVRDAIRYYHKLHSLYDEHGVDAHIHYLLALINDLSNGQTTQGVKFADVFTVIEHTMAQAIRNPEGSLLPPDDAKAMLLFWRASMREFFLKLRELVDVDIATSGDDVPG